MAKQTMRKRYPRRGDNMDSAIVARTAAQMERISARELPAYVENPPVTRVLRVYVQEGATANLNYAALANLDSGNYNLTGARYQWMRVIGMKVFATVLDTSGSNVPPVETTTVSWFEPGATYYYILQPQIARVSGLKVKPSLTYLSSQFSTSNTTVFATLVAPKDCSLVVDVTCRFN